MSSDLYGREIAQRLGDMQPVERIEPAAFDGFLRGTGMTAMRALARTGSAVDLIGAVGPMAEDAISGGTEAQDRYFKEHEELWGRAVEYWTPKPEEVGIAGQLTGELLAMIPLIVASPALAIGGIQVGEAEELVRRGAPAKEALAVGTIQAAGLGLGIYVPILGRTLAQRLLVGGAGFNVMQGAVTRGLSADVLREHPELAAMYGAFDPAYMTLDVLLGLAFGGLAHVSPAMRAQGGEAMARVEKWLQGSTAGERDALATMRQAQHLGADSLPGRPLEPQDAQFHVERAAQALEQAARNEPIDVSDIPEPRVEPMPEVQAERARNLEELVQAAEAIRQTEGLARPPEDVGAPPRLVPEDLTRIHHTEQARALGQAVENRLLELKVDEAQAKANAAVWEAFFETTSRRYGVRVADMLADYGIDVRRMSRADIEQLQPGALTQAERADTRLAEGKDYEAKLWGEEAPKPGPELEQARSRYNDIRKEFGLEPITDWKTRPERLLERAEGAARAPAPRREPPRKGGFAVGDEVVRVKDVGRGEDLGTMKGTITKVTQLPPRQPGGVKARVRVKWENGAEGVHDDRQVAHLPVERAPGETLFQSEARSQIVQTAKKMQARWYSELERQITAANIKASAAKGWKDYLKGLMGKGAVKADELKWSGIEEWLDLQGGRVTKEQVLEFLKKNGVKVEETVYGGKDVQQRNLDDPEIVGAVRELNNRYGITAELGPEQELGVIGFVTEPGSVFDGDIVSAAEIRQAAREARAEASSETPGRDATTEAAAELERAADLAQRIEAYYHGEAVPQRMAMEEGFSEGIHPMGAGRRVDAGEVLDGAGGDFTGPGWVYTFGDAEWYILEGGGANRFRVPMAGAEQAFPTKAKAEQALWAIITSEHGLTRGEEINAWSKRLQELGWNSTLIGGDLYIATRTEGEPDWLRVSDGTAAADGRVPDPILEIAESIEVLRNPAGAPPRGEERATKFSDYQLPGGENYREITLRLPEPPEDALPKGYSIKEQARPENYQSEIDKLTEELRQWQHERGHPAMSADELRMSLEDMDRPRPAHRALDIEWLRNFEGRWEIATQKDRYPQFVLVKPDGSGRTLHVNTKDDAIREARGILQREGLLERDRFTGSHFPDTDVLAHVRMNERTDAEGKRILFVEEVQSDWAQKARKSREAQVQELMKDKKITEEQAEKLVPREAGFFHEEPVYVVYYETPKGRVDMGYGASPEEARAAMDPTWGTILKDDAIKIRQEPGVKKGAVPAGPFVGKTEQWAGLVLKRMIREAAERGFDKIAWTTGEQQVKRYQSALRKAVDSIDWKKTPEGVQLIGYKGKIETGLRPLPHNEQVRVRQLEAEMLRILGDRDAQDLNNIEGSVYDGLQAERNSILDRYAGGMRDLRKKVVDTTQKETDLSDAIGKAMADQIRNNPAQEGTIEGPDLRIDDTGMAGFYDRILPSVAKGVMKQLKGGKPTTVEIGVRDESSAPLYRAADRELPELDDMAESARDAYGGVQNFADGEAPMIGTGRILIDGQGVDVEVIIAPDGVHLVGEMEGQNFELLVPKDRLRPSAFKLQDNALNAVDEAWGTQAFWDNVELISGDVRVAKPVQQPGIEITPELRERALGGMPLFQAPERGAIRIGPETTIALFEQADASTFLHESSHLFLTITRDMASRGGAPLEALNDWSSLARWLKIEGGEITREQQEKFATTFERYLAEGKAPSEELRSVFQQFRDWLLKIYRTLATIAEDIPDEIRGVMDRMLASQRRDPTPRAEGPPPAEAEPPPPPGEAAAAGRPEAMDWRAMEAAARAPEPTPEVPNFPLTHPQVASKVEAMLATELGWAQIGGRRADVSISSTSGQPNFTEWIPKSEVWPGRPAKHLSEAQVRRAVEKARAGERLGKAEAATVDYLVSIANQRIADMAHLGGAEEWNATARDAATTGLEPSTKNVLDTDAVARASEVDELGVERAAQKYENDDAGFMAQIERILASRRKEQAKQGAPAGERGEEGALEAQGGEPGAAQPDPLRDAALAFVEQDPERLIAAGKDAQGNTTYKSLRQYLDDELIAAREAREDVKLFEAAASCLYGRA